MDRRDFHVAALAGVLAALSATARAAPQVQQSDPVHDMSEFPPSWTRADRIAMVLYPGFTALDLVGPQYMFGNLMGATDACGLARAGRARGCLAGGPVRASPAHSSTCGRLR